MCVLYEHETADQNTKEKVEKKAILIRQYEPFAVFQV